MNFVLAAGGTGGHMVPAHALAAELTARGHGVMVITDERGSKIPGLFDKIPVHVLPARQLGNNPWSWLKAGLAVMAGRSEAKAIYRDHRPDAAVGFGGYPAFPSLLAASAMGIPSLIHEQNAVLGRVNRMLAGRASAIATSFGETERLKAQYDDKVVVIGNPVRSEIARIGELPFPPFDETAPLKILVTGGSQGATILGEVVPGGLGMLEPSLRRRLQVVQQCRPDDIEEIRARYLKLQIPAELMTYILDMPDKLAAAHLVISRSGATTVAELTAAGRPAILVPFAAATDGHQTVNAGEMVRAGGARLIPQSEFTPDALAKQVEVIAADPEALGNAAARSLTVGRPNAAHDLADLAERVAGGLSPLAVGPALEPRKKSAYSGPAVPA